MLSGKSTYSRISTFLSVIVILFFTNFPNIKVLKFQYGELSVNRTIAIIVFIILIAISITKRRRISIKRIDIFFYLFILFSMINFFSISWLANLVIIIIIPYILGSYLFDEVKTETIKNTLMIAGLIQSLFILYSTFINPFQLEISGFKEIKTSSNGLNEALLDGRVSGSIGHPVVLGALLLVCLVCGFFNILRQEKMLLSLLSFILTTVSLTLTYSRGSWISAAIVILIMLIFVKTKKVFTKEVTAALLIFILVVSPIGNDIINRFSETSSSDFSVSHRSYMVNWTIDNSTNDLKSFVFGYGFGGSLNLLDKNSPKDGFPVIDNVFLSNLIDFGLIGLLLFFILLGYSIIINFKEKNKWIQFVLIAIIINGLTFDLLYWEQMGMITFLILGLAMNGKKKVFDEKKPSMVSYYGIKNLAILFKGSEIK